MELQSVHNVDPVQIGQKYLVYDRKWLWGSSDFRPKILIFSWNRA